MLLKEWERAIELCEWGKRWKLDGVVRMEHELCVIRLLSYRGLELSLTRKRFSEVILCDFTDGLELVSNSELSTSYFARSHIFKTTKRHMLPFYRLSPSILAGPCKLL